MDIYPFPPRLAQSPYLDALYAEFPSTDRIDRRSPRRAIWRMLFGRGQRLFHLHFFDALVQHPHRIVCWFRSLGWILLLAFIRACGVRIVWTVHNLQPHECYHPSIAMRTIGSVIRQCHALTVHHHSTKASIQKRYPHARNIHVIAHGHASEPFGPLPTRNSARTSLGLDAELPVFLYLGMIRRYKGLEGLIEAMALLPQTLLIIAGHPGDKAYLSEIHQRSARSINISLHPRFMADAEAARYLAACDGVVLPYTEITTSGMLVAAQAAGVVCVVPNLPPLIEQVRDGVNGFVYLHGNTTSLVAAMERLISAPNRDEIGRNARTAIATHTWPTVANQFRSVFVSVLQEVR
jgi:beta-1,4-mannosyltransferase